jgi:hypothetical protein
MASVSVASKYADKHTIYYYALILNFLCENYHMNYTVEETPFIYLDMKMNYLGFVL